MADTGTKSKPEPTTNTINIYDSSVNFIYHVTIATVVVIVWRGVWYMLDLLFPNDLLRSGISSILISLIIPFFIWIVYPCINTKYLSNVSTNDNFSDKWLKIAAKYCLFMMYTIQGIAFWRGVWVCCDVLLHSQDMIISSLMTAAVGIICLFITQNGSNLLVCPIIVGSDRDNEFMSEIYNNALILKRLIHVKANNNETECNDEKKKCNVSCDEKRKCYGTIQKEIYLNKETVVGRNDIKIEGLHRDK